MKHPNPLGTLYLVPTPLDSGSSDNPIQEHLPTQTLRVAAQLQHWISENAKTTRAFLKRVDAVVALATPIQNQHIQELPRAVHKTGDHRSDFDASPLLQAAMLGMDIGLVSEAGMPAIADPGSSVVRAAHRLGIAVSAGCEWTEWPKFCICRVCTHSGSRTQPKNQRVRIIGPTYGSITNHN